MMVRIFLSRAGKLKSLHVQMNKDKRYTENLGYCFCTFQGGNLGARRAIALLHDTSTAPFLERWEGLPKRMTVKMAQLTDYHRGHGYTTSKIPIKVPFISKLLEETKSSSSSVSSTSLREGDGFDVTSKSDENPRFVLFVGNILTSIDIETFPERAQSIAALFAGLEGVNDVSVWKRKGSKGLLAYLGITFSEEHMCEHYCKQLSGTSLNHRVMVFMRISQKDYLKMQNEDLEKVEFKEIKKPIIEETKKETIESNPVIDPGQESEQAIDIIASSPPLDKKSVEFTADMPVLAEDDDNW
eukprot:gnl/Carplike_NY0171/5704_a7819_278.p1 GENE.gnl/Carplike_NY0171/5704_a7819_278~~gnl/Carplike_NY0171/5704_a7819_278.p1  ORF type:complete len:299 (-),score=45.32 gnl/Carplike_NY0171/5704_a7819_278:46-942(-)